MGRMSRRELLAESVVLSLAAKPLAALSQAAQANYLDLAKDQVIPGGLAAAARSGVHQYFDDRLILTFPYELKLKMWFQRVGQSYQRTGKIHANVPLVALILSKERIAWRRSWKLHCEARLAMDCGNPFEPFRFTTEVPELSQPGRPIVLRETIIEKPEAVIVDRNVYLSRPEPVAGEIVLNLPPAAARPPVFALVLTGNLAAEKSWRQVPDIWDRLTGLLQSVSFPVGMLLRKPDRIAVNNSNNIRNSQSQDQKNSQSQNQGQTQQQVAEAAAAAAAAAASSSSSSSAVPGAAAGSSGSSSGAAGSGR